MIDRLNELAVSLNMVTECTVHASSAMLQVQIQSSNIHLDKLSAKTIKYYI